MYISDGAYMPFSRKKGEFDRNYFNRLDRPVEEFRPNRPVDPTGFHLSRALLRKAVKFVEKKTTLQF